MVYLVNLLVHKSVCLFLAFFAFLYYCDAFSGEFEPGGKPQVEIVNPGAEVLIGELNFFGHFIVDKFACTMYVIKKIITILLPLSEQVKIFQIYC